MLYKILVVGVGPQPPTGIQIAGESLRLLELCKRLSQREEFEIHIIAPAGAYKTFLQKRIKVHFHIISFLNSIYTTNTFNLPAMIIAIIGRLFEVVLLNFPYSKRMIVISPSDFLWHVLPAFLLKRKNLEVKWLASVYHLIPHPSRRVGGYKLSNMFSYIGQRISLMIISRWADAIQTETKFLANELVRRYHISPRKIITVQSGIDPNVIDRVSWNGSKIYDACFLARLHPSKGVFDLVKAWKDVCKYRRGAKLAIAGRGSAETIKELKYEIKKLSLENNVDFLGFLSEEEKYRLYKSSKLYVLPSYEEGIPITFYEAMYCGLPVITYYLPTYAEIKDYIVSVPLGNVKKLAGEIIRILEDKDLAHKLGDIGRRLAEEHTWDEVADFIISQIENLAHEGH